MPESDPVRRLCAAVTAVPDQDPSSDENAADRRAASGGPSHERLVDVVRHACLAAGLDRSFLQEFGPPGDRAEPETLLLVLPAGANEARVVRDITHRLDDAATGAASSPAGAPRLVIAFDQGLTRLTGNGFEGTVVTAVHRMCTDARARTALTVHAGPGVAVVLSAALLDDLAPPGPGGRDLSAFAPLTVELPDRLIAAWLHAPGRRFEIPARPSEK
ncbi:hypothetical protein [Actinomadura oligospora]|uniref:hypothetical protein n=1 Tax=Actinomadura oligospora TaxID=111804 RepID=UPI00047C4645|nr:hypothetical protein [Actinomadura oligospora]